MMCHLLLAVFHLLVSGLHLLLPALQLTLMLKTTKNLQTCWPKTLQTGPANGKLSFLLHLEQFNFQLHVFIVGFLHKHTANKPSRKTQAVSTAAML